MRLLLVEDDRRLAARLIRLLRERGYIVDHVANGVDAAFKGAEQPYAIVLLDLGLPGRSGIDALRSWRAQGMAVPVLILTARDSWPDRVEGLRAGADDYLGKPFQPEELLARIEAIIRRHHGHTSARLSVAGVTLDADARTVELPGNKAQQLTGTEFRLLQVLMLAAGRVVPRERLYQQVFENDDHRGNVLDVYIRRLRSKIGDQRIVTRRGQGYLFPAYPETDA